MTSDEIEEHVMSTLVMFWSEESMAYERSHITREGCDVVVELAQGSSDKFDMLIAELRVLQCDVLVSFFPGTLGDYSCEGYLKITLKNVVKP